MKSSLFCILMHILNHVASTCSWVNSFWSPVMVAFFLIGIIIRTVQAALVSFPLLQVREGHADAAQLDILESWLVRRCSIGSSSGQRLSLLERQMRLRWQMQNKMQHWRLPEAAVGAPDEGTAVAVAADAPGCEDRFSLLPEGSEPAP